MVKEELMAKGRAWLAKLSVSDERWKDLLSITKKAIVSDRRGAYRS
jgi:hypothetical protein